MKPTDLLNKVKETLNFIVPHRRFDPALLGRLRLLGVWFDQNPELGQYLISL